MLYIILERYNDKGEPIIDEPYYIPRNDVLYSFFLYHLITNPGKAIQLPRKKNDFDLWATPFWGWYKSNVYHERITA